MTDIITKSTVFYVVEETTEGTPVWPTSGGQAVAIQPDISMAPNFDNLENEEFKSSIGKSQSVVGAENPTFSMSHYLKGSGSVATAPQYDLLLKSFFGSTATRSTERDTVSGSTTTVLNVDTGEGAEFGKGHCKLIKDSTNGYSVRFTESVSSDALTLNFALANAPASGVNLGRDVRFSPASTGHVSLALFRFLGDGGGIEMTSGMKCTGFSFNAQAGAYVNATFNFEGLGYYFNPIEIESTDTYIDFTDDQGTAAATITAKTYKDPHELAEAIQNAMDGATSETITCTYDDDTGKFTIASSTSAVLSLLWNTGTNAANTVGDKIGFSVAGDDTGATSYTSDNAISFDDGLTASYDSTAPLPAKNHEIMIGTQSEGATCFAASTIDFSAGNTRAVKESICAETGRSGSNFTGREVTVSVSSIAQKYDSKHFKRYRKGDEIRFQYTFGEKSSGNWIEGKTGAVYISSATVTSIEYVDADGLIQLNMTLSAFVNSDGDGEVYLGFV
jgi:hypothetical protein